MKKALPFIITVIVIISLVILVIFAQRAKKIPANPGDLVGNTSGNLNNSGLFCESDGIVYFSNPADNGYLYRMNADGSDIKRIMDVPASYINAGGNYLYLYYDDQGNAKFMGFSGNMRGIYRLKKDGKGDLHCLDRCVSGIATLIGNNVYYQHYDNTVGMTLYSTSLDGKDKGMVADEMINPACVLYGNIYYPDPNNLFYLNEYTPGSDRGSMFIPEQMYNPTAIGDYIYYMSVNDNYRLYRYNLMTGETVKVTNDRIDTFNVYGDMIFYQRNKEPALIAVRHDGSNPTVIAAGNYKNINCTSTYTYFMGFEDNIMYRTPTGSGGYVETFMPEYIE